MPARTVTAVCAFERLQLAQQNTYLFREMIGDLDNFAGLEAVLAESILFFDGTTEAPLPESPRPLLPSPCEAFSDFFFIAMVFGKSIEKWIKLLATPLADLDAEDRALSSGLSCEKSMHPCAEMLCVGPQKHTVNVAWSQV